MGLPHAPTHLTWLNLHSLGAEVRIVGVELQGFRGYEEASFVDLEDFTVLAGRNDAGKSSVFEALRLFLGRGKPDALDFSVGSNGPIRITCTFTNLPPQLVIDESAPTNLADEYLLDDNGNLRISKSWTRGKTAPDVSAWAMHPTGEGLPLLIGLKQPALKKIVETLGAVETISDRRVNLNYRRAIWDTWNTKGEATPTLTEIPLNVEDGKQVAQALENMYPVFHLFQSDRVGSESDDLAQDPAKLVVESVLQRHTERLQSLTADVQAEIQAMLSDVVDRLAEVAPELASKLSPTDIKPAWQKAFSALQFVDERQVPLAKRGSGTRRLVLLSFFRAEVERGYEDTDEWRRGIIIAVEEPETALHPDLQRETLAALLDVSSLANRQVLLTTHSSNLIREVPLKSVRFVSDIDGRRKWLSERTAPDIEILEHLATTMGTFTDHNVRCFVLVEGRNDITGLLRLSDGLKAEAPDQFPDLRDLEARGEICFVPIGGCGAAALWESRLSPFQRSELHLLDSDREAKGAALKPEISRYKTRYEKGDHERATITVLERREMENYLTVDAVNHIYSSVDGFDNEFASLTSGLDWHYLDVPNLVAQALHAVRSGSPWESLSDENKKSKESKAKKGLAESFKHPSVAHGLLSEGERSDLLGVMRFVQTCV